jgi:hypothetical protein
MKPVDIDKFIEYLKLLGLVCTRHESSHYVFDYPDGQVKLDMPLIVRINKDKQIPLLHLHTNLTTHGKSHKDFEGWLRAPKKKLESGKKAK